MGLSIDRNNAEIIHLGNRSRSSSGSVKRELTHDEIQKRTSDIRANNATVIRPLLEHLLQNFKKASITGGETDGQYKGTEFIESIGQTELTLENGTQSIIIEIPHREITKPISTIFVSPASVKPESPQITVCEISCDFQLTNDEVRQLETAIKAAEEARDKPVETAGALQRSLAFVRNILK